jgi:ankyrin repeat protein
VPDRHFPVCPDLDQLRHQAKDLLRAVRAGDLLAVSEFQRNHPGAIAPGEVRLADAQLALSRAYGIASWPRLVAACRLIEAIWHDDVDALREMVRRDPRLLHEDARGVKGNWGPPMSYAANLGRNRVIEMLREEGAEDVAFAFDRACLQGQLETARRLHAMGARPGPGSVMGPCETLNSRGLAFLLDLGADLSDDHGDRLAPVAMVLETYSRNPEGKRECLELMARHGVGLPDTAPMAVHRGRVDLLDALLARDPGLLNRTFAHEAIYPPSLGCHADHSLALGGTPLDGATLLHMCVDFDEFPLARWLLDRGADVNARAAVDADGFGGHTPLFGCVVSQPYRCGARGDAFARLLLDHGADPNLAHNGGWTPLYLATDNRNIENGDYPVRKPDMDHLDFIKLLLDKGANVNARMKDSTETRTVFTNQWLDENGGTAFFRASQSGDVELMKLLLARGADPKIATVLGVTALHVAAGIGWVEGITNEWSPAATLEAVKMLIDLGLDVNAQADTGRTAMHGAAHKGRPDVVQVLFDHGARLDVRDYGNTDNRGGKLAVHTWQPVDYADGLVRVGVQSAIAHPETGLLIRKLMAQAGLEAPPFGRTLESICITDACDTGN